MPTPRQKGIIKRWVAALRSKKYKQGKGVLRSEKGNYCCLGVLCDVVSPKGWHKTAVLAGQNEDTKSIRHRMDDSSAEMISHKHLARLTGLANCGQELAIMNDNGKSFAIIADYIENAAGFNDA